MKISMKNNGPNYEMHILDDDGKAYNVKHAVKVDEKTLLSIEHYMLNDGGVKPVHDLSAAFIVDEKKWFYKSDTGGFVTNATIIQENGDTKKGNVIFIQKDDFDSPPVDNAVLVHEALGHIGFEEYISSANAELNDAYRLSEAFSRVLGTFVNEHGRNESIVESSSKDYPAGTSGLVTKALKIYFAVGKKALTSIFYHTKPGPEGYTLIDEIYHDKDLIKAMAVFSARYGGCSIGRTLREQGRDDLIKKTGRIYDEIVNKSSGISEKDLMFRHLSEEFSLGQSFAEVYLREIKPSCLEELILNKSKADVSKIDVTSRLKWVWAHAATNAPDYELGLNLLNYIINTISSIKQLDEFNYGPFFQHDVLTAYSRFYGTGNELEKNFKRFEIHFKDLNGLFGELIAPFVVAKKKLKYALLSHFDHKSGARRTRNID